MRIKAKYRGKGNILLVEWDPVTRTLVSQILTREGYSVFECEDGYQAFLLSESLIQPLHLLLAEVQVGEDLSGVELARHLQVLRPGLYALFLSTIPANPVLRKELESVLDSYLSKPFVAEDLVAKVSVLMAKSRARAMGGVNGGKGEKGGKGSAGSRQDWRPAEAKT